MHEQGLLVAEIEERTGLTRTAINRRLERAEVPTRTRREAQIMSREKGRRPAGRLPDRRLNRTRRGSGPKEVDRASEQRKRKPRLSAPKQALCDSLIVHRKAQGWTIEAIAAEAGIRHVSALGLAVAA